MEKAFFYEKPTATATTNESSTAFFTFFEKEGKECSFFRKKGLIAS